MNDNLNPERKKFKIGKRELKTIEIFPLSIADQFKLSDLINEGIQAFSKLQGKTDDKIFIGKLIGIIRGNMDRILKLAVSDGRLTRLPVFLRKSLINDITNEQAIEIAQIIYTMNYEVLIKKVQDLLEKHPGTKEFLLGRSLPVFSGDTLNTDSKISTKKASGKGD